MTKGYKLSLLLVMLYIIVITADTNTKTVCSNNSHSFDIPVVTFCADSMVNISTNGIVLDGFYANMIPDKSCRCVIRSMQKQTIQYSSLRIPTKVITNNCGTHIRVQSNSTNEKAFIINCEMSGAMNLEENEEINIVLHKIANPFDARYCLLLANAGTVFTATCVANHITSTLSEENTLESTKGSTVSSSTELHATSTQDIKTYVQTTHTEGAPKDTAISKNPDEDDNILYIGVGAGVGAVLLIILILIVIGYKRRQTSKTTNKTHQSHQYIYEDEDDDELKYNVLYMSSDNVQITHCNTIDDNRISYDIEGNYTMVDTDDNATANDTNNVDKSFKPEVAPKPKNNTLSKPQNLSVKHISTGDGGCEYAVVQKSKTIDDKQTTNPISNLEKTNPAVNKTREQSKSKHTVESTYAVVSKTKKQPKGTNPVNNTYAVVDKAKNAKNKDSSINEMKAAQKRMSRSDKAKRQKADVANSD